MTKTVTPTYEALTELFSGAGHAVDKWPNDYRQLLLTTLKLSSKQEEGGEIISLPSIANFFHVANISGCKVSVDPATPIEGYAFDAPKIWFTPPSNPGNKRSYFAVPNEKVGGIELVAGKKMNEYVGKVAKRARSDHANAAPPAKRSSSSSAGAAAQERTPMATRQGSKEPGGLALADASPPTAARAGRTAEEASGAGTPPASQRARHSKQEHPAPPQPETMDIEMLAQLRAQVEAKVRAQVEEEVAKLQDELEKKDNEMTKLRKELEKKDKELAGKDAEMAKLHKKLAAVRGIVV